MQRTRINLGDESGIALVMALGIMLVLTIVLTTVITFTAAGARDSERVNAGQKAFALAEAGINNALAVLNANYPEPVVPYPGNRCLLGQKAAPTGFPGIEPPIAYTCAVSVPQEFISTPDAGRPGETATWWGRVRIVPNMGWAWVISSTGSVPTPTGPGSAPTTRTIFAKVPIVKDPGEEVDPGVLNFIYSVKDADLAQAVKVNSPLYVRGNLKLGSGVDVRAPIYVTCVAPPEEVPTTLDPCPGTAGNVLMENTAEIFDSTNVLDLAEVSIGGQLVQDGSRTAGTSSSRLSEAHVVNGCKKKGQTLSNPCQWDYDDIFVDPAGATGIPTIPRSPGTYRNSTMPDDPVPVPPVLNDAVFYDKYLTAQPGPVIQCDQGTYPPLDNNEVFDVLPATPSLPGVTNLITDSSYECTTNGGEGGMIKWDYDARTLTIKGTIFIDGSVEIDGPFPSNEPILYQGQGNIYVSGTFGLKNTTLCAVIDNNLADGSPCNLAAWDPNANALIIIARSRGDDLPVLKRSASDNNSVEVVSSHFQGALFGIYDVSGTTSSVVQGPVISTGGKIVLRNTAGASFPDVYFAPADTPGYPPTPTILLAPREFGGGG